MKINMTDKTKTVVKWVVMIGGGVITSIASQMLSNDEARNETRNMIGKGN